jgi:hypothetical protein
MRLRADNDLLHPAGRKELEGVLNKRYIAQRQKRLESYKNLFRHQSCQLAPISHGHVGGAKEFNE